MEVAKLYYETRIPPPRNTTARMKFPSIDLILTSVADGFHRPESRSRYEAAAAVVAAYGAFSLYRYIAKRNRR